MGTLFHTPPYANCGNAKRDKRPVYNFCGIEISPPLRFVPVVPWINWDAVEAAACDGPCLLHPLFVPIVTRLAQCLVIRWIPEEFMVTFVRGFMIDHLSGNGVSELLMHHA